MLVRQQKIIVYASTLLLLIGRIYIPFLETIMYPYSSQGVDYPRWLDALGQTAPFVYRTFISASLIPIAFAILVYRNNLEEINVDKIFLLLLPVVGIGIVLQEPLPIGWLTGIATLVLGAFFLHGNLKTKPLSQVAWKIILVAFIAFLVCIMFITVNSLVDETKLKDAINDLWLKLTLVTYEEAIFRGLLWVLLTNAGFGRTRIIIFQTLITWVSHLSYSFANPLAFWLVIPLLSILLGVIVQRSKSLTPSVVVHLLYNIFVDIII